MREIKSQKLDREAFRPYGDYIDLLHVKQMEQREEDNIFVPDLVELHLDGRMPASICVARVSECERVVSVLEYHQFTCEGILPLDGDIDIFVGPSSFRVAPETVEAFRVPQGTVVRLNPGDAPRPAVCGGHPRGKRADPAARAHLWQRLYLYPAGGEGLDPHRQVRRGPITCKPSCTSP